MKSLEYADCIGYDACIISYCLYLMCNHLLPLMNRLPQCGVTFKLERVKYIIGSFSYDIRNTIFECISDYYDIL